MAAEQCGRRWLGIDISPKTIELVRLRTKRETTLFDRFEVIHRTDIPTRTAMVNLPNYRLHQPTLFGRQEGTCTGCLEVSPFRNFTADPLVPRAQGGQDDVGNLQLLCGACHSLKGTRAPRRNSKPSCGNRGVLKAA